MTNSTQLMSHVQHLESHQAAPESADAAHQLYLELYWEAIDRGRTAQLKCQKLQWLRLDLESKQKQLIEACAYAKSHLEDPVKRSRCIGLQEAINRLSEAIQRAQQ